MSNKVIYHGGCADGWCAAWIAAKYMNIGEENLIAASYGSELPVDRLGSGDQVFIVDFSYPAEQLKQLCNRVAGVVVLDHHKTAQAELEGLNYPGLEVHFDMERSGARMTFDYFLCRWPDLSIPVEMVLDEISKYVQDRDLWQWKLEDSREVSAFLSTLPKTIEGWDVLLDTEMTDIQAGGTAVLEFIQRQTETLTHESKWSLCSDRDSHEPDIAIINICVAAPGSEVLGILAQGRPMAVGWAQSGDGSFYYSLRSDGGKTAADVGLYARGMRDRGLAFAGGGHARAAGFSSWKRPDELFVL